MSVKTRRGRTTAGQEVVSATVRLLDGLRSEEDRCSGEIAAGLQRLAMMATTYTVGLSKHRSGADLVHQVIAVLPPVPTVGEQVLPPISDLLAMARERSLVVARRQMRSVASLGGGAWDSLVKASMAAAKDSSMEVEQFWYGQAQERLRLSYGLLLPELLGQASAWLSGDEPIEKLTARWFSFDPIRLPGSHSRGVWPMVLQPAMAGAARNGAISVMNGVLLSAMQGWNAAVRSA